MIAIIAVRRLSFLSVFALLILFSSCKKKDPPIEGCMTVGADNYNPDATVDNGTCQFLGCTDPDADNYDPNANTNDGNCLYFGCMDPLSENYNEQANVDDGSCVYARDKFIGTYNASEDCPSGQYNWSMTIEEVADGVAAVFTKNIGDFDQNFPAAIEGDKMTFDYENTVAGTIIRIDGSGTLDADGKTLRINYHVEIPSYNFVEDCEVVAIKQ